MASAQRSAEVVVIGAGIVGSATAYELASQGVDVLLIDPDEPGSHQSGRNWGFVRQQGRSSAELPLMRLANERWQELEDELDSDINWVQGGNIAVYDTAAEGDKYRKWVSNAERHGVNSKLLTSADVQDLVPGWRRPITGGIFAPDDGQADPVLTVRAYINATVRCGGRVHLNERALMLEQCNGRLTGVRTNAGTIACKTVVCACGAWSRSLLGQAGVDLPQSYVHGTVALTNPQPHLTTATVWAPGLSFRQRVDGRLVCATGGGGTIDVGLDSVRQMPLFLPALRHNWRKFSLRPGRKLGSEFRALLRRRTAVSAAGPPAPRASAAQVVKGVGEASRALSGLVDLKAERTWAGIIDTTPDGLPVIDADCGVSGLVLATGFSGHGFGLGPAAGLVTAKLALGHEPGLNLQAMRFRRFQEGDFTAPAAIL